jgi:FixJ family two-component response regulator
MHQSPIAIVDDDPAMRRAVARLCGASALDTQSFSSAEEFLASDVPEETGFLILDIHLSGISLHEQLASQGIRRSVAFITGQDQPLSREKARKAGAAAYLTKPFAAAVRGGRQVPTEFPSTNTQSHTPP